MLIKPKSFSKFYLLLYTLINYLFILFILLQEKSLNWKLPSIFLINLHFSYIYIYTNITTLFENSFLNKFVN